MFQCYGGTPHLIVKQLGPTTLRLQNLETNEMVPSAVNMKMVRQFHGWDDTLLTPLVILHPMGHHIADIIDHKYDDQNVLSFKVQYSGYSAHSSNRFEWLYERNR